MTFKESMDELNNIVKILDNNDTSLEESIEVYKRGITLAADCKKRLEEARQVVTVENVPDTGNGNA